MKEKIRLLTEGKKLVLIIEDSTPEDVERIKRVFGEVLMSSVEGIEPTPARDIPIPEVNAAPRQPQTAPAPQTPIQSVQGQYSPVIFSKGKYAGRTLGDVMACDCAYVKWLAVNRHNEFRWEDLYYFRNIWTTNATRPEVPYPEIIYMIETIDVRPTAKTSLGAEICEALGIGRLQDIRSPLDENFVRTLTAEALKKM